MPTVNKVSMLQEILYTYAGEQGGIIQAHLIRGGEKYGANHCPELIIITEVPQSPSKKWWDKI